MAVADVPGRGLDLRGREGEGTTLSECLTVGGRPCHHGVVLLSVGCHDGGEVRCFVHVLSIGSQGVLWGFGGHSANWSGSRGVSVSYPQTFHHREMVDSDDHTPRLYNKSVT